MSTWREQIAADEDSKFNHYATEIRSLQVSRPKAGGPGRALHLKQHVGAVGELRIPQLPAPLNAGPFEKATTYPVYVRFSNGTFGRKHDGVPDIRGLALKLVGVPGKKVIPGLEDKQTQDFLLIQSPALPVATPDEFLSLIRIVRRGQSPMLVARLIARFGFAKAFRIIKGAASSPKNVSLASLRLFTAAPQRWGDEAVKVSLVPQQGPSTTNGSRDHLREDLVARLQAGPLEWSLQVQLFVDEQTTPIEDASVLWPEEKSPFREVGRLVLPKQDVTSTRGKEIDDLCEQLSFDPWHAHELLRPLGAMMRARSHAYRESTMERKAAPEPEAALSPG